MASAAVVPCHVQTLRAIGSNVSHTNPLAHSPRKDALAVSSSNDSVGGTAGRPACDGYQSFSQAESLRPQGSYKPESSEFETVKDALLRWRLLFGHETERASSQAESRGRKKIRKGTSSCEFGAMCQQDAIANVLVASSPTKPNMLQKARVGCIDTKFTNITTEQTQQ